MELFKLLGKIVVNNSEANDAIEETTGKTETFGSKLMSGIETVASWSAAIVAGATAAAGSLIAFASSSASSLDTVDKMSQMIGISREAYQELDFICSQSGTSVDTLQMGIKSLTAAMDGASSGTASNVEQFEKLGISVTDANGNLRSQEDVMWETMEALQGMENQTEKARLATELFGRSGTELMPLLNGASGSIEEMKQQAHDLGLVLNDELIDSGVELTDSMDQTKRAFKAIAIQLGGSLMPIVTQASDYIQQSLPAIQEMIAGIEPIITSVLEQLLPPMFDFIDQIFPVILDSIEQILPPLMQLVQSILPLISPMIESLLPPIIEIVQLIISSLIPAIQPIIDSVLPVLLDLINMLMPYIQDFLQKWLPMIVDIMETLIPPLMDIIEKLLPLLTPILDSILELLDPIIAYLDPMIELVGAIIELLSPLIDLLVVLLEPFMDLLEIILPPLIEIISAFIAVLAEDLTICIEALAIWINETLIPAFTKIKDTVIEIKDKVVEKFEEIKTKVVNKISYLKEKITTTWENIKESLGDIVDNIKQKFSDGFNALVDIVKVPLNSIIGFVNHVIDALNSIQIDIPDWVPEWGGTTFGINIPKLDYLAEGGVITDPTLLGYNPISGRGVVAGEAGDEAIAPIAVLQAYIEEAVARQNYALVAVLEKILEAIIALDENMGGNLREALAGTSFSVNNREFARLVKEVN